MARARKKGRARDARGHFVKAKKKARRAPVRRKRGAAKRRGTVRVKRALGRKRSNGRFVRRSKHRVKAYRRKGKLVRAHSSYEAAARKRRRARRAREAEETAMAENPRRRHRRRSSKRRHHRAAMAENPRKRTKRRKGSAKRRRSSRRRAKRRTTTAVMPAIVRRRTRKGGRRTSPASVRVVIAGLGRGGSRKRRSSKRRSGGKRRKGAHKRRHARRRSYSHPMGYTGASHQLAAERGFFENPIGGGHFMENPLSGGELALSVLTGTVGFAIADLVDRYFAVKQYMPTTAATGTTPLTSTAAAIDTVPGWMRMLAQATVAAIPLAGAYFVHRPMARAALQGAGLGALLHLGGQLFNHYVMAKLTANATAGGTLASLQQYYQQEIQADAAATASGLSGFTGLGAPPTRARIVSRHVATRALAAKPGTVGNCLEQPGCGGSAAVPCLANDQTNATAAAAASETGDNTLSPVTGLNGSGQPSASLSGWSGAFAE